MGKNDNGPGLTLLLMKGQSIKIGDDITIYFKKNNSPGGKFTAFRIDAPKNKTILALDENGDVRKPGKER